jgi:hypothetical protein
VVERPFVALKVPTMISAESDFDAFRDDFALYLAGRLGVSKDAALTYLGDWLIAFKRDANSPLVHAAAQRPCQEPNCGLPDTDGGEAGEG